MNLTEAKAFVRTALEAKDAHGRAKPLLNVLQDVDRSIAVASQLDQALATAQELAEDNRAQTAKNDGLRALGTSLENDLAALKRRYADEHQALDEHLAVAKSEHGTALDAMREEKARVEAELARARGARAVVLEDRRAVRWHSNLSTVASRFEIGLADSA
jgi:hypothetical protein